MTEPTTKVICHHCLHLPRCPEVCRWTEWIGGNAVSEPITEEQTALDLDFVGRLCDDLRARVYADITRPSIFANRATLRRLVEVLPALIASACELVECRRDRDRARETERLIQSDLRDIMNALRMSTHARTASAHKVVQDEVLPLIAGLREDRDRARAAAVFLEQQNAEALRITAEAWGFYAEFDDDDQVIASRALRQIQRVLVNTQASNEDGEVRDE